MRSLFAFLAFVTVFSPLAARAEALTDVYGDSVTGQSVSNVLTAQNAAGAPDEKYADFRGEDAYVVIDMGEGEEGIGDLIMTFKSFDIGAEYLVMFYDKDMEILDSHGDAFGIGVKTETVVYSGSEPYRFVKIFAHNEGKWSLDAIQATQVATPGDDAPVDDEEQTGDESIPYMTDIAGDVSAGTLVKTTESPAVYLLGQDGMRHAFPKEEIFTSWGYDFSDVVTISAAAMAEYRIGKNITVRPGTWLIKMPYDPKVYAVGAGGALSYISSEAKAKELYGSAWNTRVLDVSDVFFKNYTLGTASDTYPTGSVIEDGSDYALVTTEGYRALNDDELRLLRINYAFAVRKNISAEAMVSGSSDNGDLTVFYQAY